MKKKNESVKNLVEIHNIFSAICIMSLKAMPAWMHHGHGSTDEYQFNEVVKPDNLNRLPPLNEQEVCVYNYMIFFPLFVLAIALLFNLK